MTGVFLLAGGQLGPIARSDSRTSVVARLMALMRQAHAAGARLIVFPELALTTFFPRWFMEDQAEVDGFFETEMPNPATKPLFELAHALGIGFYLGYAEKTVIDGQTRRFNSAILVNPRGRIVGKYRKIHLPGHADYVPSYPWQHLEKRYFEVGDLGFPVWRTMGGVMGMAICNDRRWPETFRVMGLQGVELVMLGYNTPAMNRMGGEAPHLRMVHHALSIQSGAYQNGTYVCAVAKAGMEEGCLMMGGSAIVSPAGEIIAQAATLDDELILAPVDLEACQFNKTTVFNFAEHRRIEHYSLITTRTGAQAPPPNDPDDPDAGTDPR